MTLFDRLADESPNADPQTVADADDTSTEIERETEALRLRLARLRPLLRADEQALLDAMQEHGTTSFAAIARLTGWDVKGITATWKRVERAAAKIH